MKPHNVQFVFLLAGFVLLCLGGCSDFEEMKGQRMMLQVEALMEQGAEKQAEEKLTELIALYPGSQAGKRAVRQLAIVQRNREQRELREFTKILDSYQQVLKGYRALYAEYPSSLSVLDESDYFFDSVYLDDITPAGYRVYLWLNVDGSGYRVWCVADDNERGYTVGTAQNHLVTFERDNALQKIKSGFQAVAVSEKLTLLSALH